MHRISDFFDAIRVGIHAAREHLNTMRWLRSGRCPDLEPPNF